MKRKLSFAELEKEMNLIASEDWDTFKGGYDTTINPTEDPYQTALNNLISSKFSGNLAMLTGHSYCSETMSLPSGFELRTNSSGTKQIYDTANSKFIEGLTSGGNMYISPSTMGQISQMKETMVGHEILHMEHFQKYASIANSDPNRFIANSEYYAYKYQFSKYKDLTLLENSVLKQQRDYYKAQAEQYGALLAFDENPYTYTEMPTNPEGPTTIDPEYTTTVEYTTTYSY